MKTIIIIMFITFSTSGQEVREDVSLPFIMYNKCFDNLKPMTYILENSNWQDSQICNLAICSALLIVNEIEAVKELKERIIEITGKWHANGTPIKLISGLDSSMRAQKLNENLKDDNGIVYLSVSECTSTYEDRLTKELVNAETERLIKM